MTLSVWSITYFPNSGPLIFNRGYYATEDLAKTQIAWSIKMDAELARVKEPFYIREGSYHIHEHLVLDTLNPEDMHAELDLMKSLPDYIDPFE